MVKILLKAAGVSSDLMSAFMPRLYQRLPGSCVQMLRTKEDAASLKLIQLASMVVIRKHWTMELGIELMETLSAWLSRDDLKIGFQDQMSVTQHITSITGQLGLDVGNVGNAGQEPTMVRPGPLTAADGAQPCANHLWVVPGCGCCQSRPQPRHYLLVKGWAFSPA